MRKEDLLTRIDAVISKADRTLETAVRAPGGLASLLSGREHDYAWVEPGVASEFRSSGLSILRALYGPDHHHYKDFDEASDGKNIQYHKRARGVILAVREEVDRDWLTDVRSLIAADIFSDFLEMSAHLLGEGYKDAAAVLIGGALEGHLRSLCTRFKIPLEVQDKHGKMQPRAASTINEELYRAKAYLLNDQKQILAWQDLRNDAAHGHYDKYPPEKVEMMLYGVRNFIARVPA